MGERQAAIGRHARAVFAWPDHQDRHLVETLARRAEKPAAGAFRAHTPGVDRLRFCPAAIAALGTLRFAQPTKA